MVAGEDDHRRAVQAALTQEIEEPAEVVVELLDEAHVGGNDALAHLVAAEGLAGLGGLVAAHHGVRVAALGLPANGGLHVLRAVHRVVGRRGHIGPVRLDVAQVQQPGHIAGRAQEVDGAVGEVGRLAVRLGHAGRAVGPAQLPAGKDFAVVAQGRIGVVVPGVRTVVALRAQPVVVAHAAALEAGGQDAVEALPGLEAAFHGQLTGALRDVHAQALRALEIGLHVGLAQHAAAHAAGPQVVAQRLHAHRQRHEVPCRAVAADVAPGVGGHARSAAHRPLHEGACEAHASRGQGVQVRGVQLGMAGLGQVIPAQLIGHDEKHVLHVGSWLGGATSGRSGCPAGAGCSCAPPRRRRPPSRGACFAPALRAAGRASSRARPRCRPRGPGPGTGRGRP